MNDLDRLHDALSELQEDIKAIRHGRYDPPRGTYLAGSGSEFPTPDEVVDELREANVHLGEISTMLWLLGLQIYDGNWNEDVQRLKPSGR